MNRRADRPRRRAMAWFVARMTLTTALLVAIAVPAGGPLPAPGAMDQMSRIGTIEASAVTAPPTITSTPPGADKDVFYTTTMTATGGVTPYVWSVSAGSLPTGITLNSSTGVVSGTPTTIGSINVTFKITDATNITTDQENVDQRGERPIVDLHLAVDRR